MASSASGWPGPEDSVSERGFERREPDDSYDGNWSTEAHFGEPLSDSPDPMGSDGLTWQTRLARKFELIRQRPRQPPRPSDWLGPEPAEQNDVPEDKADDLEDESDECDEAVPCEVCDMLLSGPGQYEDHLRGKRHRHTLRRLLRQAAGHDGGD